MKIKSLLGKATAALVVLSAGIMMFPTTALASPTYNFDASQASYTLDGTSTSYKTAVMAQGNYMYSSPNLWWNRMDMWGESSGVNSYLAFPNSATGVYKLYFLYHATNGSYPSVTGIVPGDNATSAAGVNWIWSYVPYVGSAISAFANSVTVGTKYDDNSAVNWQQEWDSPSGSYNLSQSVSTDSATEYTGWSQKFYLGGTSGDEYQNTGYIQYLTSYNYGNTQYEQYSYDNSGDIGIVSYLGS